MRRSGMRNVDLLTRRTVPSAIETASPAESVPALLPRRVQRAASGPAPASESSATAASAGYGFGFGDAVNTGIHTIARKGAGGVATGAASLVERAADSSGNSLPEPLMRKFEQSLDTDLSSVRVHTGGASAAAAGAVSARAYATGQDIHFGAGQYDPTSTSGQQLIAHEVAHTVQQRGAPARQHKLEVSSPGDACETEADAAADAMVQGAPATVSTGSAGRIARWRDGDMDAGVRHDAATDIAPTDIAPPPRDVAVDHAVEPAEAAEVAAEVAEVVPAGPVSIAIQPQDWMADARAIAAGLSDDSSSLGASAVTIADAPDSLREDHAALLGWARLQQDASEASSTWNDLQPRIVAYLGLPEDFRVPGGGGMRMHEVTAGAGAVDGAARTRAFDDPGFQAEGHRLRAAEHTLTAAVAESRAAGADIRGANQGLERVTQIAAAHRATARREGAEGRRADATAGRSAELARIQNYIRIAEVGIGLLAGGMGAMAAGSAAMAPAVAPTIASSARSAVTSTVAGVGSNGLHDLAVGAIAEAFVSGRWDIQIRQADREIAHAARQIRAASAAADQAAIDEQLARQEAANERMNAANERLRAAHLEYQAQVLALASAARRDVGGPEGRQMQGALAALLPVQARLARLAELQQIVRVPSYTVVSGCAYALLGSEELGPARQSDQFVNLISRLVYLQDSFLARELAQWRAREREITAMIDSVAPDDSRGGR